MPAVFVVASCGEMTPAEQARMDVELACLDKASTAFPILAELPDIETDQNGDAADFRLEPSGSFVWTATVVGKGRPLPDRFSCAGNMNERRIELVEFNGVKKRPPVQEVWKF